MQPIILQSLKKFLRGTPVTQGCIVFGHNWAKISNFAWKIIFWENSINWFNSPYCDQSFCKFEKYNLSRSWGNGLHNFRPQWGQNYSFGQKEFFLEIWFKWFLSIYLSMLKSWQFDHAEELEKNSQSGSWVIKMHNFGHNIAHFLQKRVFWKNSFKNLFIYLLCPIIPHSLKRNP